VRLELLIATSSIYTHTLTLQTRFKQDGSPTVARFKAMIEPG